MMGQFFRRGDLVMWPYVIICLVGIPAHQCMFGTPYEQNSLDTDIFVLVIFVR
jgi:hypothetical protein